MSTRLRSLLDENSGEIDEKLNELNNEVKNGESNNNETKSVDVDETASTSQYFHDLPPGICEECECELATCLCAECGQAELCDACYRILHRKGKRLQHNKVAIELSEKQRNDQEERKKRKHFLSRFTFTSSSASTDKVVPSSSIMMERAKYIPVRLEYEERKYLRLLRGSLAVNDYTNRVDSSSLGKAQRDHTQIESICALLTSIVVSLKFSAGEELVDERDFKEYEQTYQLIFEIFRRYKIMNPDKLRAEYGKLIYLLQDASLPDVTELLEFSCLMPIKTVWSVLEELGGTELLNDKYIDIATQEILPDPTKKRHEIQREIKRKQKAIEHIADKYETRRLDSDTIKLCLYSICDNNSFLNSDRLPIDKMIIYLKEYFHPTRIDSNYSLAIYDGEEGSRLTHDHARQYHYVLQSLTLWKEIINDFFRLWYLAEEDLLGGTSPYVLSDTGQGLQRVQNSPRTYRAIQEILLATQQHVDDWIGSSVIHLGDHNVPNALIFIDKYTQVPRILSPIINVLEQLEKMRDDDESINRLVDSYGGTEKMKKEILHDFFRHAFDGSGADNFFDAGSCIDGRLTSAWHWCQSVSDKPYWPLFQLTGFLGFDGEFNK